MPLLVSPLPAPLNLQLLRARRVRVAAIVESLISDLNFTAKFSSPEHCSVIFRGYRQGVLHSLHREAL